VTAEFAHLPQDVRPIAALDAEARIAHIRAERWVQHAAADRVLGYLQEALEQPPRERMENILLIGESGMGGAGQGSARATRGMPAEGRPCWSANSSGRMPHLSMTSPAFSANLSWSC
jgi:hypothetical protein